MAISIEKTTAATLASPIEEGASTLAILAVAAEAYSQRTAAVPKEDARRQEGCSTPMPAVSGRKPNLITFRPVPVRAPAFSASMACIKGDAAALVTKERPSLITFLFRRVSIFCPAGTTKAGRRPEGRTNL